MEIQITSVVGGEPDESELRSLHDWLLQETPRPGQVSLIPPAREPETMGALTDTLQVALGTGGALTVLAGSIGTWIQMRRENLNLVLERPNGERLVINGRVKNPEAMIERFLTHAADD